MWKCMTGRFQRQWPRPAALYQALISSHRIASRSSFPKALAIARYHMHLLVQDHNFVTQARAITQSLETVFRRLSAQPSQFIVRKCFLALCALSLHFHGLLLLLLQVKLDHGVMHTFHGRYVHASVLVLLSSPARSWYPGPSPRPQARARAKGLELELECAG